MLTAQRGLRLVRNILISSQNTYLQLRGVVWGRWVRAMTSFQVELAGESVIQAVGIRLAFEVTFNEFSPQAVSVPLDLISVDVFRALDGMLIAEADFNVEP